LESTAHPLRSSSTRAYVGSDRPRGTGEGDEFEVDLELDTEAREVEVPADLVAELTPD